MNPTPSILRLKRQIDALRQKLLALGPLHPGSVSPQYHVCGNPGCRCMHPQHPKRHGPYHKLAYVHGGRPVCRFVRADCLPELQRRLANYKNFRGIINRWIALSIQWATIEFFNRPPAAKTTPERNRPHRRKTPRSQSKPT